MLRQEKIKKENKVEILIISNTQDFSTDYICVELNKSTKKYLRINRDELNKYEFIFSIDNTELIIKCFDCYYIINNQNIKSIYYRAPIYLRDIYQPEISKEEQLYRSQWMAFVRNLSVFNPKIWVNNPSATFVAENKIFQLTLAKRIGLEIPETYITNSTCVDIDKNANYIVKSLDTAVLRIENKEAFVYSNKIKGDEFLASSLQLAPVILQNYIYPKIDIRVTIIENIVFAVRITHAGEGVDGDWRKFKNNLEYRAFELPDDVRFKCLNLVNELGLNFAAIDMIESNDKFIFIELNPTGEWAWLVDGADLPINKAIAQCLLCN